MYVFHFHVVENGNILKSPTVKMDLPNTITSAATSDGHFGPPAANVADTMLILKPSSDSVTITARATISCQSRKASSRKLSKAQSSWESSDNTITITFDNCYLVNHLKLDAYPDTPGFTQKSFSYTIKISKDNKHWVELFKYRSYSCFSTQVLCFPTQAVRHTYPWPLSISMSIALSLSST